ncbi:MAG: hypothetical protein OK457_08480 [Thaumarchaeota archaeon]|nr:hypothetical protein [Nitrososphaerota archaeon]
MPQPKIPYPLKMEMIRLRLEGSGRTEIWRKLKPLRPSLSPASVSGVLFEFENYQSENGIGKAGEVYGVKDQLEKLLEISDFSRKTI